MNGCNVRTIARPASRSTPPRLSLRALDPVRMKRGDALPSRRSCTTCRSSGTRCTSSTTTSRRPGLPRTSSRSRSGLAINSRCTSGRSRLTNQRLRHALAQPCRLAGPARPEKGETSVRWLEESRLKFHSGAQNGETDANSHLSPNQGSNPCGEHWGAEAQVRSGYSEESSVPTVLRVGGLRFVISNDHAPANVHVRKAAGECRIVLDPR